MNYYEILEISQNASNEVVKMAYKALVKKYHPDVNGNNTPENEKKMKQINEAYSVLSDPDKRKKYDIMIGNKFTVSSERQKEQYEVKKEYKENREYENQPINQLYEKSSNNYFAIFCIIILFITGIGIVISNIKNKEEFLGKKNDISIVNKNIINENINNKVETPENNNASTNKIIVSNNDKGVGIKLNDSQAQVKKIMGVPNKIEDYDFFSYWYYGTGYGASMISFGENKKVTGWEQGSVPLNIK